MVESILEKRENTYQYFHIENNKGKGENADKPHYLFLIVFTVCFPRVAEIWDFVVTIIILVLYLFKIHVFQKKAEAETLKIDFKFYVL